jgi:PilZ domain
MAFDETSDGADYLAALKKSSSPQTAGTATARAREGAHPLASRAGEAASTSKGARAADKRKTPRYRCKGSARLQESGTAAIWARFVDISLHGCYVEAATPLRVGTMISLTLELNGFRVEASGEVRVTYPNLGMGIHFVKVSETNRDQLRAMVGSISKSSMMIGSQVVIHAPLIPQSDSVPGVTNPVATLQAIVNFFENRHVMGREEFLSLLRKSQ